MFKPADLIHLTTLHVAKIRADFEEEVREWYEEGDGRPSDYVVEIDEDGEVHRYNAGGSGYRFPTCIHGANLWVDHDIPCGTCEGDDRDDKQLALDLAEEIATTVNQRHAWISYRPDSLPSDLTTALIDWTFEPLKRIQPKKEN